MGMISYDTTAARLRIDLVQDPQQDAAPGEYIGMAMKDVELAADQYYRLRSRITAYGDDLTGIAALTTGHDPEYIRDMKAFDVSQPGELVFHSGSGGTKTLLLAVVSSDSNAYYYIDSLVLETVAITDSILYSNDFSSEASGWRTSFSDSMVFTAGRSDWQAEQEHLRLWPWADEAGVLGAVTREVTVVPGIYNMVTARLQRTDEHPLEVSVGAYNELSDNVTFPTLSSAPYAHVEAEHFTDTTVSFWFLPDREKVSLVVLFKGAEYSRLILDDVTVAAIDPYGRDTVFTMSFGDTNTVYEAWRSSLWPDSLISADSVTAGMITHDTITGRMRVDMVTEDPFSGEGEAGVVYRKLTGLEVDKEYEAVFRVSTDGANRLRQMSLGVFNDSEFSMGIIGEEGQRALMDSLEMVGTDSLSLVFTATEENMAVVIFAGARIGEPYHYYLDDFRVRQYWRKSVNCDRSNLDVQYADNETKYRFGFNRMERDDEFTVSGGSYDFGARIYDSRLGKWLSIDPHASSYPSLSPYSAMANNPMNVIDPDGKDIILIIYTVKEGDVGHAAIAIENYQSVATDVLPDMPYAVNVYEGTGKYILFELGPLTGVNAFTALFDRKAYYGKSEGFTGGYSESDLLNKALSQYEDHAPEGVIKFDTDYYTDQKVRGALEQFKQNNPEYNATSANCSDYALCAINAATNSDIKAKEKVSISNVTTPNKLYQEAVKLPNAQILKDAGKEAEKPFKDTYDGQ